MRMVMAVAAVALSVAGPAAARSPAPVGPEGIWINPYNSVAVRTGTCGAKLCGWIVWANREAQADAREGGIERLVGAELLENYSADGVRSWRGTVFVPDMGRRFDSRIDQLSLTQLRIKGCILGGLICRSQLWNRIDRLPND